MTCSVPDPSERPPNRKAVLFCPDCAHESLVDGDWLVRRERGAVVYRCPVCRTAITTRPGPERRPTPAARWTELYADWVGLWTAWYRQATSTL